MIPIDVVESTATTLMEKAAIEIPEDYLQGVKAAAEAEDGDLLLFVLQAMLENYEVAKEDRRAMCGDTGSPRWYVKMGNEARIDGGPIALEAVLRRATAKATNDIPLRPQPGPSVVENGQQQQYRHQCAGNRICLRTGGRVARSHHRPQGRPVRHGLPDAVPERWHPGHQAVLPGYPHCIWKAGAWPASRP